jgi:hypothetical protein
MVKGELHKILLSFIYPHGDMSVDVERALCYAHGLHFCFLHICRKMVVLKMQLADCLGNLASSENLFLVVQSAQLCAAKSIHTKRLETPYIVGK